VAIFIASLTLQPFLSSLKNQVAMFVIFMIARLLLIPIFPSAGAASLQALAN